MLQHVLFFEAMSLKAMLAFQIPSTIITVAIIVKDELLSTFVKLTHLEKASAF